MVFILVYIFLRWIPLKRSRLLSSPFFACACIQDIAERDFCVRFSGEKVAAGFLDR